MDQWLDSLSEDWVSQPRSAHSSSLLREPVSRDSPNPSDNALHSRIPRYKPRSASSLSTGSVKSMDHSTGSRNGSQTDGALREKTSSKLNASQKPNGKVNPRSPNAGSMRLRGRQASTNSIPGTGEGTVQHKSSPAKKPDFHGTPDWKKRILKENVSGDLFSPIGLESVFKPPTVKANRQAKPAGKGRLPMKECTAPNPPPQPLPASRKSNSPASNPRKTSPALPSDVHASVGDKVARDIPRELAKQVPPASSQQEDVIPGNSHQISGILAGSPHSKSPASPILPLPSNQHVASTHDRPRTASTISERSGYYSGKSRNENISPFNVSRKNTVDGRVEYTAVDTSIRRLHSQMDRLRLQQQNIPTSRSSDTGIDYTERGPPEDSVLCQEMDGVTSQSLPDDLSMGTDAYAANGGFISIRRGGYSNDGSFQRRPISPSLLPDLDGPSLRLPSTDITKAVAPDAPQNFSQTKSRTPSSPPPLSLPQTPKPHKHERSSSDDRPKSSGSPLKLFDKYDTFTNEKLIRRMSKFEETLQQDLRSDSEIDSPNQLPSSPSPRRRHPNRRKRYDPTDDAPVIRRISSFGDGELNDHRFPPYQGLEMAQRGTTSHGNSRQQADDFQSRSLASRRYEDDNVAKRSGSRKRVISNQSQRTWKDASPTSLFHGSESQRTQYQQKEIRTANRKRLLYSPAKNPAPKRRRTLLTSEAAHADLPGHLSTLELPIQSISGRKRKDARYDTDRQSADPDTLAMRPIRQLKGRSMSQVGYPTTSHRVDVEPQAEKQQDGNSLPFEDRSNPSLDPPTQIVAGALATIALNTAQEVTYGSRKASVTTADFFNEAQQIMQLIRAKGRPRSSHATTGGSEVGHPTIVEESFGEDFTKDEFSRPPSREGKADHLDPPEKLDARVVSHLRKFEDDQDLGLALSSSLKTLEISEPKSQPQTVTVDHEKGSDGGSGTESDPPNIRIQESVVQHHKRKYSSSTHDPSTLETERQNGSRHSHPASGFSSGRSNPPGSSQSSTNRMIIAPETVAHLLSDQMAGMIFDRQKQLWVKRKSSPNIETNGQHDHTASEETEDDLFGDIPDLSVNEMEELQRVKDAVSSMKSIGSLTDKISIHDQAASSEMNGQMPDAAEKTDGTRPRTAEGNSIPPVDDSSAPSKFSHFASSGFQPGTRATSWGDDAFPVKEPQLPRVHPHTDPGKLATQDEEQVEHEISIFEGRDSHSLKPQGYRKHQARVVTVAFSSPLIDRQGSDFGRVDDPDSEGESVLTLDDSPVKHNRRHQVNAKTPSRPGPARDIGRRSASRRMSVNHQSFLARPMSRLDEEEEMSLIHCSVGNRRMSMEVAITTPLPVSKSLMIPPSTNGRSSVGFHLSPLPDFTVHQVDKPIDSDDTQVAKRLPQRDLDYRLSLAAQDLVKNLTDLEPYEPYWDYIRRVDLRDRDLGTLHMLKEFCGRVEELDVSDNQIGELNGIPHTVRALNIRNNCLSDLAAWDPLRNLQYLDVSNNRISSLQGFQNLFHLRLLKVDGNEIGSMNGLEDLNGLTDLCLRNNRLGEVDFENYDLQRLTKLDLHGNELIRVSNIHRLPALETCILSNNGLEALDFAMSVPLEKLNHLDISDNQLSFIDLAEVPKLKTLKLDRNFIASIESLNSLKNLETLSWREQTLDPAYGFSEVQYEPCHEVRKLYLSGNSISSFAPSTCFLNLQALELASTGLQNLSSDFGLRCPNLRTVNLNYNAIRDLRPLLGVVKLQRLYLAGNRVSRLRRTAAVLDRLGKDIVDLDLRNNPLTVGFYTPPDPSRYEKQMISRKGQILHNDENTESRDREAYLLPPLEGETDERSKERLDEDTKLRRRVYEMLIVNGCKKLERMDGLEVNRKTVGSRDAIWERLVELGVLKEKDTGDVEKCTG